MSIAKSERQLVVMANLATTSRRYLQLYKFLDGSIPVAVARTFPSGLYASDITGASVRSAYNSSPLAISHTRTVWSRAADANRLPSGCAATAVTPI